MTAQEPSPDAFCPMPESVAEWMESSSTESREFIVQAELPARQVSMEFKSGRPTFGQMEGAPTSDREALLEQLLQSIRRIISGKANALKAAGAVVIDARPRELRQIARLPGIREIRENRRLPRVRG